MADEVLTEQIRVAFNIDRSSTARLGCTPSSLKPAWTSADSASPRLMLDPQLVGCRRRKRSFPITQQDPTADVAADRVDRVNRVDRVDRVDRQFIATMPDQSWVADVTDVPDRAGPALTDLRHRRLQPPTSPATG